jgi:type IV pilus assembly protein PilQ
MGLFSSGFLVLALAVSALADAPPASSRSAPSAEARISLDFKDADIVDIVRLMAEVGNFQVVVDPGITCKLTLKLKEVPWDTALEMALRVCGLGSESENGIVRVAPVAKLTAEHEARRKLAEEQRLNRPLRTTRYTLSYARAAELAPLIKKFLSPRGDVVFDARTNTLIITDID